ncbi:Arginine/serine-rich coiled-coil protein 2-like [Oopsacas minuta]|uniref:Arginine/serine-rich coiled-coil protein 2-like n=1 Tax=Oopsacas minuta TaxID=111878 RepID=A0AAV7JYZ9_9METZ|nr:Arginine/serine-rich coiled-coil protein 2-like [Oopsacas minuta]
MRRVQERDSEVIREREFTSRRRDRDSSPHRRSHKHHRHRRSRHSSSDSDSPDRHRNRRYRKSPGRHSRSPRRRYDDRDPSDRSYRSRREYTPPRTITSARSPPRSNWQGSRRQQGENSTSALNSTVTNPGIPIQPGNPYGMSQEKFRNLQNKKKLLWSKDTEEDTRTTQGSVYIAATSSLPVNQDKKEKFSKMMGLKSPNIERLQAPSQHPEMIQYDKTQEDLQKQYDASRVHTHMMKGSGLGYGNIYQV